MATHTIPTSSETRAADILAAAERLFSLRGFDGVSMNEVAQEAGVSKANIFHHFGSKDELYLAVLQQVHRELSGEISAIVEEEGAPLERRLARVADTYLRHLLNNEQRTRIFMRECIEPRPGHSKALAEKVFGKNFSDLVRIINDAKRAGEVRNEVSPALSVLTLIASCIFFFQHQELSRHLPGADASITEPDTFTTQLVAILLHGIVGANQP